MINNTCIKCGHIFKINQGIDWNGFGYFHRNTYICKPKRCFFPKFRNIDCYIDFNYKRKKKDNKIVRFCEEIRERRQLRFFENRR